MKYFAIAIVLIGLLLFAYIQDKKATRRETIYLMDSLYSAKKKIINYDSIEKSIRHRVTDSIGSVMRLRDWYWRRNDLKLKARIEHIDSMVTHGR